MKTERNGMGVPIDPAIRKRQLIAQGAAHRAEILLARETARSAVQPAALARSALAQAGGIASILLARRAGANLAGAGLAGALAGIDLQAVMPMAMAVLPMLSRHRRLWKPVLAASATAALGVWLVRRMRRKSDADPADTTAHD